MIHLTGFLLQRGPGAPHEGSRKPRGISAGAETYADAKRMLLEQLADGWIFASFRVF